MEGDIFVGADVKWRGKRDDGIEKLAAAVASGRGRLKRCSVDAPGWFPLAGDAVERVSRMISFTHQTSVPVLRFKERECQDGIDGLIVCCQLT